MASLIEAAIEEDARHTRCARSEVELVVIATQGKFVAYSKRRVSKNIRSADIITDRWGAAHQSLQETVLARALTLAQRQAALLTDTWNDCIRNDCYEYSARLMTRLTAVVEEVVLPESKGGEDWPFRAKQPPAVPPLVNCDPAPCEQCPREHESVSRANQLADSVWLLRPDLLATLLFGLVREQFAKVYGAGWCCALNGVRDTELRRGLLRNVLPLLESSTCGGTPHDDCPYECWGALPSAGPHQSQHGGGTPLVAEVVAHPPMLVADESSAGGSSRLEVSPPESLEVDRPLLTTTGLSAGVRIAQTVNGEGVSCPSTGESAGGARPCVGSEGGQGTGHASDDSSMATGANQTSSGEVGGHPNPDPRGYISSTVSEGARDWGSPGGSPPQGTWRAWSSMLEVIETASRLQTQHEQFAEGLCFTSTHSSKTLTEEE